MDNSIANVSIAPRSRAKLPANYASFVTPLVLSIVMTFVVSAISTLKTLGLSTAFFAAWPTAWGLSLIVAFPTSLAVLPVVQRIVAMIVHPAE